MNWYKKAQAKSNWKKILAIFGTTLVTGLATLWGLGLLELENLYTREPQKVEQALQQYQQNNQTQVEDPMSLEVEDPMSEEVEDPMSLEVEDPMSEEVMSEEIEFAEENIEPIGEMIERYEGKRSKVYLDTEGFPIVGIGFNLNRANAKSTLSNLGIDIKEVLSGKRELTDKEIYSLFNEDVRTASNDAKQFIPNFNEHPKIVQNILIDMSFSMGYPSLSKFKGLQNAVYRKQYKKAAEEMKNSRWYSQLRRRSKELVSLMEGV